MSQLARFAVKNYLPRLTAAFFVVWFAFTMWYLWLYIDDYIGKGIEAGIVLRTLGLQALPLVPGSLPLAILFSAIIYYGDLGESSELTALKSSGISLARFVMPQFILVILIAVGSFFFNDQVIPTAQIKAFQTYYDIANKKPAVNIKAGVFYKDIPNQIIYVGSKETDNQTIHDVKIYDHSKGQKGQKVTIAKHGKMYATEDKNFLIFELRDGWRYEEKENQKEGKNEQIRLGFKYWKKVFDLSDFALRETDEEYFQNMRTVMTVKQISKKIDTTAKRIINTKSSVREILTTYITALDSNTSSVIGKKQALAFKTKIADSLLARVANSAEVNARSVKNTIEITKQNLKLQKITYAENKVEYHKRFTLPFACIILFIIGAALGAIIRKGGLGMPLILAVCFFVIYYVLNTIGEKISREMIVEPWQGMWLPSFLFSVLAIYLLYKANNDSPVFNKDWFVRNFGKLRTIFKRT